MKTTCLIQVFIQSPGGQITASGLGAKTQLRRSSPTPVKVTLYDPDQKKLPYIY